MPFGHRNHHTQNLSTHFFFSHSSLQTQTLAEPSILTSKPLLVWYALFLNKLCHRIWFRHNYGVKWHVFIDSPTEFRHRIRRVRAFPRMEASSASTNPPGAGAGTGTSSSRRFGIVSASNINIIEAPLLMLLEYSGILRSTTSSNPVRRGSPLPLRNENDGEEVSIRIIGASEQDHQIHTHPHRQEEEEEEEEAHSSSSSFSSTLPPASNVNVNVNVNAEGGDGVGVNGRDSSSYQHQSQSQSQRYDIQHAARWIEQLLPFSLLLLLVFIRQHLQGFSVTIWIAAVLFKSNDFLRKQTALKGERKIPVLVGISIAFALQVVAVYWWYRNDDLMYPLFMLPPRAIPPFWHAIFIITVNDILVRQAAMVFKCILLMWYKNSRGRNYCKQGQLLTLVEYLLLLYRALLPTPVWYRFFLNKEYGSLFSSLMTGLYLTFKLTSVVEKVQSFFAAMKALSRKEVHYGAYATSDQVNAAGDLCAICQEKMHAPIYLRCKHIFCEDCVSEWFERERTCPLCRALVKPADLRSFGDGSTSLFCQLF